MIPAEPRPNYLRLYDLLVLSVALAFLLLCSGLAHPQTTTQPQIRSRLVQYGSSDGPRVLPRVNVAASARESGAVNVQIEPIKINVDLVLVSVVVTDALNRPVTSLPQRSFELLDQGQKQAIRFFSQEDAPMSIALVLDVSNSMTNRVALERDALARFFENANPEDEYFAIAVSNQPIV